jgi:hypothetical protein
MADTINDFNVTDDEWVDVYTTTGITVGSSITICNKGGYNLLIQEVPTKPDTSAEDGILISTYDTGANNATVLSGSSKVWLKATKSSCDVNVQEV